MADRGQSQGRQGYLAISICVIGISTSPLLYKLAFMTGLHAFWINVIRLAITTVVMLGIAFFNPKNRKEILSMPKQAFWLSALGGTLLALHLNGWALALANTEAYAASTILGIYLLLTVMFASLILKEKTSKGALGGLLIATVGVVVCNFGGGVGRLSGNMFALFAAVTEALYVLCGRKARPQTGAIAYTTVMYTFTLFWMIIMALFVGVPTAIPAKGVLWAGLLALFSTLLGHSMANVALKYFKAATVSAVMISNVITGPTIVLIFLQEMPTMFTIIGGAIIICGLAWYIIVEHREAKRIALFQAEVEAGGPSL